MKYEILNKAFQNREDKNNMDLMAFHADMVASYDGDISHLKEGYVFSPSAFTTEKKHIAPARLTSTPFAVSSLSDDLDFSDDDKAKDVDGDFSDLSLIGRDDQ
jgi:hypothetical protein